MIKDHVRTLLFSLLVVVPLAACSRDSADGPSDPDQHAPTILSFGVDTSAITAGEAVRISAIVADPDGVEDVLSGVLEDDLGHVYGNFEPTGSAPGAFELTLTWADIDKAVAITFDEPAGELRSFVARFFDRGGLTVTESAGVQLHCEGLWATNGTCGLLRTGVYSVGVLEVASETCGPQGYDAAETTVQVYAPDDIQLLDDASIYQSGLDLFGSDAVVTDHSPIDCLEEDVTTYNGKVLGPGDFELTVIRERKELAGDQCLLAAVQEGIVLPCTTEANLRIVKQ